MQKWIPNSPPSAITSTLNAAEIWFKWPTATAANALLSTIEASRLPTSASRMRSDGKAIPGHEREEHERRQAHLLGLRVDGELLFVIENRIAGHAHADAVIGVEAQLARGAADRVDGRPRRQQIAEVELRRRRDQAVSAGFGDLAADQRIAPRIRRRPALRGSLERDAHAVERAREIHAEIAPPAARLDRAAQQVGDAGDARVARELGQQRLRPGDAIGEILELRQIEEQELVALEEGTAVRGVDLREELRLLGRAARRAGWPRAPPRPRSRRR